jgi:uncharacterized protein DUF3572
MGRVYRIDRKTAEHVAIQALEYLAADSERLGRFLSLSGLGPQTIRAAADDPNFLTAVLDHVMSDENLLIAFAGHLDAPPGHVTRARAVLGGPVAGS